MLVVVQVRRRSRLDGDQRLEGRRHEPRGVATRQTYQKSTRMYSHSVSASPRPGRAQLSRGDSSLVLTDFCSPAIVPRVDKRNSAFHECSTRPLSHPRNLTPVCVTLRLSLSLPVCRLSTPVLNAISRLRRRRTMTYSKASTTTPQRRLSLSWLSHQPSREEHVCPRYRLCPSRHPFSLRRFQARPSCTQRRRCSTIQNDQKVRNR